MWKILDAHAPLKTKKLKPSHRQPWFTDNIRTEIQLRRHKEAMWLRDPSEYNLMAFYYQRRYCANLIKSAHSSFFLDTIKKHKGDSKAPLAITNFYIEDNNCLYYPVKIPSHWLTISMNFLS